MFFLSQTYQLLKDMLGSQSSSWRAPLDIFKHLCIVQENGLLLLTHSSGLIVQA